MSLIHASTYRVKSNGKDGLTASPGVWIPSTRYIDCLCLLDEAAAYIAGY